ncbi:MAG: response regulator [Burkholderiales bacterium]|nr:response regulator [Burkholderiales bacterium]
MGGGRSIDSESSALNELAARLSVTISGTAKSILALSNNVLDTPLSTLQRQQVRDIHSAAVNLLGIVNDLADYSSLDSGTLQLQELPFSLRDLVVQAASSRLQAARERNILLRLEIDGDVPDGLRGDPGRLVQVLGHLLNTILAFAESDEVLLRVEPEFITHSEATLNFSLIDAGGGLPEEVSAWITGEAAAATDDTTGLGFIFACRLVEAMGGALQAKHIGGSTLSFAVAFGISANGKTKPAPQRFNSLVAVPVVIVSDDATEREELAKLFQSWHMRPQEADSSDMALAILERGVGSGQPIPLLVFTNRVQGQDGFLLAMQIKRHSTVSATSLIMLTSEGRRGDAVKCREAGVVGYLLKPINPHDLAEAVNTILGVRKEDYTPTLVTRHSLREKRQGATVLLIEDDRSSQLLAAHFLDRGHFSVALAANGPEALTMAEQQQFDLILLDMELKGLDGIAMTRQIRAMEKSTGGQVPIIAITAGASAEREKRYKAAGITDVLLKPLQRDRLLATVFRYVKPIGLG